MSVQAIPLGILAFRRISRNNALAKTPPRRTASASSSTLPHTTVVEALPTTAPVPKTSLNIRALIRDVIRPGLVIKARPPMEAVLRMAMAFGIATTGVAVTSAATIWGGMAVLGVNNVHEISYRMRSMLAHRMPVITSRIHNLHTYSDEDDTPDSVSQWNWVATRQRLQEIYDTEGFLAWSEAALEEMEIEARLERFHRKQADALRPA
ncbi:hypothetical protein BDZ89DRAFT_1140014 [Hymenopellis radicata]|nr:hypothetical protein BDZ89DRAFT_1140014 [Hymenopellis radicata]